MSESEDGFGFAPEHDAPIPYMQRIRDYYQALGYGAPYRWAHYAEVPFAPLKSRSANAASASSRRRRRISPGKGDQGPGAAYNAAAKFYTVYSGDSAARPRSAHLAYRLRPHPYDGRGQQHLVPAAGIAARGGGRGGSARWRRAFTARRPTAATA